MRAPRGRKRGAMRFSQEFKLETLAFIAFFATLPLYSPNLVMFSEYGAAETLMPPFVNTMMVVAAIAGIIFAWLAFKRDPAAFSKPWLVIGSSACYVAGFALFAAGLGIEGFGSEIILCIAGALVAFGMVPLCIAWGTYLAVFDMRQALFYLGIMIGVASLIALLLSSVAIEAGLVAYGLLLLIGIALPCAKALGGKLDQGIGELSGANDRELGYLANGFSSGHAAKADMRALIASLRKMASVAALPFIGLLVFAFVMGVRKFMVFDAFYVETLGGIIAAVIVLPVSLLKINRPLMSFVYQVFLPICAVILVVLNSFPYGTVAQWLAATFSYVFFGIIGILALASLCAMAHAREFSTPFIYGLTVACFMIASFLGISCGSIAEFSENAGPILLVICTVYFGFIVLAPLVSSWRREGALERSSRVEPDGEEARSELRRSIESVAARYELSPREAETLSYLGRGHGIVFIAKTLVISESTVRTHVKSIYRKLGVSSREELLELIDRG